MSRLDRSTADAFSGIHAQGTFRTRHWFIAGHLSVLLCWTLSLAGLALLLPALGLSRDETLLLMIMVALPPLIGLIYDFLRKRSYMNSLRILAEKNEDALALASRLGDPYFAEGSVSFAAIESLVHAAQCEIDDAHASSKEYRRFVETWVHEIKTPLAACNLSLENLHDPRLRPLSVELSRVESLVEQALYYARSSSVERDYLIRDTALIDIVRSTLRSHASALIEAHMSINIDEVPIDLRVPCDSKWMEFIVGQLVDNAIRYRADTSHDGRSAKLSFAAHVEHEQSAHEYVVLDVCDNGCGIAASDLERVFDRGFTGENGRNFAKSTGLGLYLVQSLCKKMGLDVHIASKQSAWTKVSIYFPRLCD